jgi:thymidine kinase
MPSELEVIAAGMFCDKSATLIRRIQRAGWARKTVVVGKPFVDTRTEACIASRVIEDGTSRVDRTWPATVIRAPEDLLEMFASRPGMVALDEAQFFPPWLPDAIHDELVRRRDEDFLIIVAGLDLDYRRQPFGPMPRLIGMADKRIFLDGVCMSCGAYGARFTQRITTATAQVVIGDLGTYRLHCRNCHTIP